MREVFKLPFLILDEFLDALLVDPLDPRAVFISFLDFSIVELLLELDIPPSLETLTIPYPGSGLLVDSYFPLGEVSLLLSTGGS